MQPDTLYVRIPTTAALDWLPLLIDTDAKVAHVGSEYWVAWELRDDRSARIAAMLPGDRFSANAQAELCRSGHRVAERKLPMLEWTTAAALVTLAFPTAMPGGQIPNDRLPQLSLVRGGVETSPSAGIYPIDALKSWADQASTWRLRRLRYCWDGNRCLVMGDPLPPIPCQYLICIGQLLIPAGMEWVPRCEPSIVQQRFGVGADTWLLWIANDLWWTIDDELLVPLSRSSVRRARLDALVE